jgi:hypothetical protein
MLVFEQGIRLRKGGWRSLTRCPKGMADDVAQMPDGSDFPASFAGDP